MDFRERFEDQHEMLRAVLDGRQAQLWTALPAIIDTVDLNAMTITATPAIQAIVVNQQGTRANVTISQLLDVPLIFPRGGGHTLTFPVKTGDECLVVFSSRCIDHWWRSGGVQPQYEQRMHDLSDGFALVGPFSQAQKISNVSATTTQLRSDDGTLFVELDAPRQRVRMTTPSNEVLLDENGKRVVAHASGTSITLDGGSNTVSVVGGTINLN